MQRSTKKKVRNIVAWTVALLFFASLFIMHWVQNYWKFDRDFVAQTDHYEIIHQKLTKSDLRPLRKLFDDEFGLSNYADVQHDFTINVEKTDTTAKSKFLKQFCPEAYQLLANQELEAIYILSKKEILFQLKWCNNASCFEDVEGFHGFYTHYLSKNVIDFKTRSNTKLIEKKQFGEWWYYIVWTAKG
ncbi:MAG: hypothetical protein V4604_02735 [Bacteroidota bacterium]